LLRRILGVQNVLEVLDHVNDQTAAVMDHTADQVAALSAHGDRQFQDLRERMEEHAEALQSQFPREIGRSAVRKVSAPPGGQTGPGKLSGPEQPGTAPASPRSLRPASPRSYRSRCLEVFDADVSLGNNYLLWSLPFGSPEVTELYSAMAAIEHKIFGKWLETIRNERIEGAIVEFGVFSGTGLAVIADRCDELGIAPPIYGFDSFEGLPEPTADDLPDCWHGGQYAYPRERVARRVKCESRPHVHLVEGWFCDTLKSEAITEERKLERIAFARIDCDLYDSTVDCLNFLADRLADGAFLVFDDWSHRLDLGETRAFFEFYECVKDRYRFEHLAAMGRGSLHLRVWRKQEAGRSAA
jgi:hypothetical protein